MDTDLTWIPSDVAEAIAAAGYFVVRDGQAVVDGNLYEVERIVAGLHHVRLNPI